MIIELTPETPKPASTTPARSRGLQGALVVAAALVASNSARGVGAEVTWDNTSEGGNTNWSNSANWVGGSLPGPTNMAVFDTSNGNQVVVDVSPAVAGLKFTGAQGFVISGGNPITLEAGTLQSLGDIQAIEIPVVLGSEGPWIIAAGTTTVSDVVSGAFGITKSGAGRLDLSAANAHTGGTSVTGGILGIAQNEALGAAGSGLTLDGGMLEVGGDIAALDRPIQLGAGGGTIDVTGGNTLNLGTSVITGPGDLIKNGIGTLVLNTYKDNGSATTINAGTLAGNGAVRNGITVANGATLSPGESGTGMFTVIGDTNLGGTYLCDLDGNDSDHLVTNSNLNLVGSTLTLQTLSPPSLRPHIIATYGSITGTFPTVNGLPPGFGIQYAYHDGSSSNHVAIVPLSPQLHWKLEEGSGSFTTESVSGNNSVAQFVNSTAWVDGFAPGSRHGAGFPGVQTLSYVDAGTLQQNGDYVTAASAVDYRSLSAWTISAWVNLPSYIGDSGDHCIITSDTTGGSGWWLFFMRANGTYPDELGFDFSSTRVFSGINIPREKPVFVSIACDPSGTAFSGSNTYRFSVWDGTSWQTAEGINSLNARLDGLEIGSFNNGTRQLVGQIDEVRIDGRALTQQELAGLVLSTPYETWAAAKGLQAGVDAYPDNDPNHDGKPNIYHFAFDTDPLGDGGSEGKQKTQIVEIEGGKTLSLTIPVRNGTVFNLGTGLNPSFGTDGILYTVHGDDDLQAPYDRTVNKLQSPLDAGLPALGPGYEYQTFILQGDIAFDPKGFLWLSVNEAP